MPIFQNNALTLRTATGMPIAPSVQRAMINRAAGTPFPPRSQPMRGHTDIKGDEYERTQAFPYRSMQRDQLGRVLTSSGMPLDPRVVASGGGWWGG